MWDQSGVPAMGISSPILVNLENNSVTLKLDLAFSSFSIKQTPSTAFPVRKEPS